jgi:nucleotide-binding universal stress UspA family protein
MNSILVLVDLTPTAAISTEQAIHLAKYKGAEITLSYIAQNKEEADSEELQKKLKPYTAKLDDHGIKYTIHIGTGDYKSEVPDYVKANRPDLVIVGTHGKKGLKQKWFGSAIYALIKSIPATTLVISDFTATKGKGFSKILLPVAAHDNYLLKVKQSCEVLAPNGTIVVFNIVKPGTPVSDKISNNILTTKEYLTAEGVDFVIENVESTTFSVGYSRETLDYVSKNNVDLISIMTRVADNSGSVSSDVDKENILLNVEGVPVLCANR